MPQSEPNSPLSRFRLTPSRLREKVRARAAHSSIRVHDWTDQAFAAGRHVGALIADFLRFVVLVIMALPGVLLLRTRRRELIAQIDSLGVGALPITHVTGFIAGLLMGAQTRVSLRQFGITTLFPQILTLALVREVGPAFVSLISGARAASGVASELATMSVTQQVDALRALRRDPITALAAPRTLACIIAFPALAIVGILAGLFGGMLMGTTLQQSYLFFFHQAMVVLTIREIIPNLVVKPALFGLLIGIVSSYRGLHAEGGTRAVGSSTVRAVVVVTVGILVTDYLVGEAFRHVWPPPPW
jgi:phospholipid/cholesterol/gamma-HCH transport system permease protein